ncbi:Platelet-derived growth factor receptor alpha [Orchesella cincta]|uniref:receptor protein-tyrosine kinase n=1 Tax=Orchesella cincta TaxID=48709 RepID=A0A1D2MZ01_ORCCI|nr:Platelet-derived growth factor receptor alpha [Orchesella cincta]
MKRPTAKIAPLYMDIINATSVAAGDDFEILCYTEQARSVAFSLNISGPFDINDTKKVTETMVKATDIFKPDSSRHSWIKRLRVRNANRADSGNYTCTMNPALNSPVVKFREVKVFDEGQAFLEVDTAIENITVKEAATARWIVNITSFPLKFNWSWKNPNGESIPYRNTNMKYSFKNTSIYGEYQLEVRDLTLDDTGNYPFSVQIPGASDVEPSILNLSLTVRAAPKVTIISTGPQQYFMAQEYYNIDCKVRGHPEPKVQWEFQECSTPSTCNSPVTISEDSRRPIRGGYISTIKFQATTHGKYICHANNPIDEMATERKVTIVDFPGDSDIAIIRPQEIVNGDDVTMTCALSKIHKTKDITWLRLFDEKEEIIEPDQGIEVEEKETQWSWRKVLRFRNIKPTLNGSYECRTSGNISANTTVVVEDIALPEFTPATTLNNSKIELKEGHTLNLTCKAFGRPKPKLTWTWENHEENNWPSDMRYSFTHDKTVLYLTYVPFDAQGKFECKAENRNGADSRFMQIKVTGKGHFPPLAILAIAILVIVVVIFGLFIARIKYKQGELNRFLKEISQEDFYKGAVENINPDLSVTDQAYLLPFDSKWEFPKERLSLGMQLGSGAFGRVVKADACGILDTEPKTTVAVKMVKPNADESHFKALMSELKIMVHLGRHINVVNLLGACTKNLAKKKELFVIVEYCKYGSLLSYLHRHRRTFINQLDPARGCIDPDIYKQVDRNSQQSQAQRLHYATLTFTDPGNSRKPASNGYRFLEEFTNNGDPPTPTLQPIELGNGGERGYPHSPDGFLTPRRGSTEHYVPESQVESVCTGMSYLSNGHTSVTTDGTSKQDQDHYRGDYQIRDVRPIKTTDLLCWAFQMARGMEYLASRKVLHGDLAARNVLLAENNVVKICDFGLAKEMYKDYKYKKKSEGVLLPVKWMAIESIYYGVFSTQSDCWSFGVVLWELFTLGKTPYPGMDADEKFYKRISEGYRMEKPALAPSCVYDIMLECWAQEPTERPSFSTLVDRIGDMMEEGLRNHYVDLNQTYMRINQTERAGQPDYLLQMSRSEFASNSARPTPDRRYQNVPTAEEVDSSGYLRPIHSQNLSQSSPSSPLYQNVQQQTLEPNCSLLANNSGYMFVKVPVDTHPNYELGTQGEMCQPITVQINYSPDIKDVYGLRDSSPSPDRHSLSDNNMEGVLDEVTCGAVVYPDDEIRGVDNMNYVPSFTFAKMHPQNLVPNGLEDTKVNGDVNQSSSNDRRQRRQKNDSGLGSIDSNQFDSHHRIVSSENPKQFGDINQFQEPNGYND